MYLLTSCEPSLPCHADSIAPAENLISRKEAARLLQLSPGTLAIWDCRGKYDLRPVKIGNRIYYRKTDLNRFLQSEDHNILNEKLLTRNEAAAYLDISPGTLAIWDCTGRYDLRPLKAGNRIRYSRIYLKRFLNRQMKERPVVKRPT